MSLHIGIVTCSAEGAALCCRTICTEGSRALGKHAHPEVSLIIDDANSALPTLDGTRLLAKATRARALDSDRDGVR